MRVDVQKDPMQSSLHRLFDQRKHAELIFSKLPPYEKIELGTESGGKQSFTLHLGKKMSGVIPHVEVGGDRSMEGSPLFTGPLLKGEFDFVKRVLRFDDIYNDWIKLKSVSFGEKSEVLLDISANSKWFPVSKQVKIFFDNFQLTTKNLSWSVAK